MFFCMVTFHSVGYNSIFSPLTYLLDYINYNLLNRSLEYVSSILRISRKLNNYFLNTNNIYIIFVRENNDCILDDLRCTNVTVYLLER